MSDLIAGMAEAIVPSEFIGLGQCELPIFTGLMRSRMSSTNEHTRQRQTYRVRMTLYKLCMQALAMRRGYTYFLDKHVKSGSAWVTNDPHSFDTALRMIHLRIDTLKSLIENPNTGPAFIAQRHEFPTVTLHLDTPMCDQPDELAERLCAHEISYYLGAHEDSGTAFWSTGHEVYRSLRIELADSQLAEDFLKQFGISVCSEKMSAA